ncbi:acyl-CoA N-acyltransferase [Chiua virens]|nr:acyl-CoA N-acyltransferase [Chiua virens]
MTVSRTTRDRLQAVQNALSNRSSRDVDVFLLPDKTKVNVQSVGSSEKSGILVDNVQVCTYEALSRTAVLLLSSVGTPHEHTATHVPNYPVLEIRPPSSRKITIQDTWAIIYALFVRYHERETIPIVFSAEIDNRTDLCTYILRSGLGRTALSKHAEEDDLFLSRAAFWQGAGTHGYHLCGWLPPSTSLTRYAASPFPSVQSFTRTPLVIAAHPLRPPKPLQGEVLYRRYCPTVGQTLEFTYFDVGEDSQVTPHLEAFHKWHNDDRVNSGWNERGSLEQHRKYVYGVLNDPAVLPMIMSWDGKLMGYLEIVYIKENHVSAYVPGGAKEWDRGIHVLVGEEQFRGWERAQAWLRSIHHYNFLADPRTEHSTGEPKADNGAILQLSLDSSMHLQTMFDFPYKRSFCHTFRASGSSRWMYSEIY